MKSFNPSEYQRFVETEFTIVDKKRQTVPFKLNRAQEHFLHNLTPLNNVLKNRKQGISSISLAIAIVRFIKGVNTRGASVSFIKESAHQQLLRAKHFLQSYEQKHQIKIPLKYNSKNEMVFEGRNEQGSYLNTLRVGTARSNDFGRGDDIDFLHVTEAALADDLEQLLAGIGEAVTDNAITILETTANGFNKFQGHWAKSGDYSGLTLEPGDNGYTNFFYDPFWVYSKDFVEKRRARLGRLGPQEYPYTAQEAFLNSGDPYFDREAMEAYLRGVKEPMGAV